MAQQLSFYPPSPHDVPPGLTEVNAAYRLRVLLLLASVTALLGAYAGLLVLALFLIVAPVLLVPFHGNLRLFIFSFGLTLLGVFMGAFLIKGLFKHDKRSQRSANVEITAAEQPRLFAFLEQLCAELGTPMPARVFVSYEVNASASYDPSIVSVLFPSRKNLLIGLGLINNLNLTEFKALLAHEFGHFSQSSMKLGGASRPES